MTFERLKGMLNGRTLFLVAVVVAYAVVFVVAPDRVWEAFRKSAGLFSGILPSLLGVFVLMTLSDAFLDTKRVTRAVGSGSGAKGWLLAIFGGVLSSGPIYLWYPLLADLRERGMREGYAAAFLLARAVKLPLLPLMAFSFGWSFVGTFSVLLLLFSFLGGIATEALVAKSR